MDWLFANWLVVICTVVALTAITAAAVVISLAVDVAGLGMGFIAGLAARDSSVVKHFSGEHPGRLSVFIWCMIVTTAVGWFVLAAMAFVQVANWVATLYPT